MGGFALNCHTRPDHLAVVSETESLTFGELDERASLLAGALRQMGAQPGAPAAVMLPNSIEYIEVLAATAKLGLPAVALNWHLRSEEVAWILGDSDARVLVSHVELRGEVEAALDGSHRPVLWVGGDYEDRIAASDAVLDGYVWPAPLPVLYTSGTSGRPKGVLHGTTPTPEAMDAMFGGLTAMWGYDADDIHLAAGPLYHAGPGGYCNAALYAGGTVLLMERWDAREFLRLVDTHRATTTFLTPAHMIRILEVPGAERATFDLTSLRHLLHAGAPCPRHVKERIMAAFPRTEVWEFYGMSEGGATRVSPEEWLARPGTVGRPWPGVEIRITSPETGAPLGPGETGLVYVKPAHGGFRYHNDDEKTASAWSGDAFTVGDVGHLDVDGYLFLTDRLADLVIRAGVNVYPREVEEVLFGHPAVVDAAVFGVPDERDGERLRAVLETRSPVTASDLDAWCRERLEPYKCPSSYELCEELPRDPNGKILKRHLRDAAWSGTGRSI